MSREEELVLKFHGIFDRMKMNQIDAQETPQAEIKERSRKFGEGG